MKAKPPGVLAPGESALRPEHRAHGAVRVGARATEADQAVRLMTGSGRVADGSIVAVPHADAPLSRRAFLTRLAGGRGAPSGRVAPPRPPEQDCTHCGSRFPVAAAETMCPACRKSLALTRDVFGQLFGARG
jgi:hypothetical protein